MAPRLATYTSSFAKSTSVTLALSLAFCKGPSRRRYRDRQHTRQHGSHTSPLRRLDEPARRGAPSGCGNSTDTLEFGTGKMGGVSYFLKQRLRHQQDDNDRNNNISTNRLIAFMSQNDVKASTTIMRLATPDKHITITPPNKRISRS